MNEFVKEFTFGIEAELWEEVDPILAKDTGNCDSCGVNSILRRGNRIIRKARKEIAELQKDKRRHGHWVIIEYEDFTCSECGKSYYNGCESTKEAKECLRLHKGRVYEYCPFCGARMDEDAAN